MTQEIENSQQVVLVTGAGSGIGRTITLSLARACHQVYASMREIRQKNRERAEAFSVQQFARIIDTNALSWLRVNRAVLPAMCRQGYGLLMYVGCTATRLHEPFLGPYIASKVAGDAIAEIMGMEVRPMGIESVILVPGAFTSGTEHFEHFNIPEYLSIEQQYKDLPDRITSQGDRLSAIDAAN